MMKKMLAFLCVMMLLLPLVPALGEEETAESYYAYFTDGRWLRSQPAPNTANVVYVPERTLLKLTYENERYAAASYDGLSGYISISGAVKVNYIDPESEDAVTVQGFFGAPGYMRAAPLKNAALVEHVPADERFTVTYVTEEYALLSFNGKQGYVYIADFVPVDYAHGTVEPYIAFSGENVNAYVSPCYGADVCTVIEAYTPISVTGYDGDHLVVQIGDVTGYVPTDDLSRLDNDFAVDEFPAVIGQGASFYAYPLANSPILGTLEKETEVTVSAFHGEYASITFGGVSGYIHYSALKSSAATEEALKALQKQIERIEAQKFLNAAFSMLEEGNVFLNAYNQRCGGEVRALYTYGAPYLFAGANASSILYPRFASQNSHYYSTTKRYLGGFDCIGYARWVHNTAGMKKLPAISSTKDADKANVVKVNDLPWDEWHNVLKVGDCVNIHYVGGGYHIMMYIGTIRDFGFTQEEAGLLAPYMDYPLVIHCGMNNFHTAWYTKYLADRKMTSITPPDGGVTVSILGVPFDQAPYTETMWKGTPNVKTFYWFDFNGYNLTIIDPLADTIKWAVVYRNTER